MDSVCIPVKLNHFQYFPPANLIHRYIDPKLYEYQIEIALYICGEFVSNHFIGSVCACVIIVLQMRRVKLSHFYAAKPRRYIYNCHYVCLHCILLLLSYFPNENHPNVISIAYGDGPAHALNITNWIPCTVHSNFGALFTWRVLWLFFIFVFLLFPSVLFFLQHTQQRFIELAI